jgi:hypothetical protein
MEQAQIEGMAVRAAWVEMRLTGFAVALDLVQQHQHIWRIPGAYPARGPLACLEA